MKKCTGTIYKINGKYFCVGEKKKSKNLKKSNKSKRNIRVTLKKKSKKLY